MSALGPAPEAALPDARFRIVPEPFVKVDGVAASFVYHQHHLVIVGLAPLASLNSRDDVGGGDLRLMHGHVPHLWAIEVHAIADGVHTWRSGHAHLPINAQI